MIRRILLASLLAAGPAMAQMLPSVSVDTVWARATAGAGTTGAVYATITANEPDRLIGASTPVAGMAQLHQSIMKGGTMEMRPVDGLSVTPGTPVQLSPGGYHVMLMGLKHPLKRGDHFPVTLTFEHAGAITVEASVAAPGARGPDGQASGAAMPGMPGMAMPGMPGMSK